MIAILVAVNQELRPILRRARASQVVRQAHLDFHEGTLAGLPVALLALGAGPECARIAAETTVRCYRPDLIISAGFGGGLTPQVRQGDVVIGTEILELKAPAVDRVQWRTAVPPVPAPALSMPAARYRLHYGKVVTGEEMVLQSDTKRLIGRETGALSVDMETSAVAVVAAAHRTAFLAVRCISDGVGEDLPEEFNDFFVVGQLQPKRILSASSRRPRLLLDLSRLGYRARRAGQNLARFLEAALPQLPLEAVEARRH